MKFIFLSTVTFILSPLFGLLTLIFGLIAVERSLVLRPTVLGTIILGILIAILLAEIYRRTQWNEELRAELFVLESLGKQEYTRRNKWFEQTRERGFWSKIQRRLFYPDPDDVIIAQGMDNTVM